MYAGRVNIECVCVFIALITHCLLFGAQIIVSSIPVHYRCRVHALFANTTAYTFAYFYYTYETHVCSVCYKPQRATQFRMSMRPSRRCAMKVYVWISAYVCSNVCEFDRIGNRGAHADGKSQPVSCAQITHFNLHIGAALANAVAATTTTATTVVCGYGDGNAVCKLRAGIFTCIISSAQAAQSSSSWQKRTFSFAFAL